MISTISYLIFQTIIIFIIATFFSLSGYYKFYSKKSREDKISYVCEKIAVTFLITFIADFITYWIVK